MGYTFIESNQNLGEIRNNVFLDTTTYGWVYIKANVKNSTTCNIHIDGTFIAVSWLCFENIEVYRQIDSNHFPNNPVETKDANECVKTGFYGYIDTNTPSNSGWGSLAVRRAEMPDNGGFTSIEQIFYGRSNNNSGSIWFRVMFDDGTNVNPLPWTKKIGNIEFTGNTTSVNIDTVLSDIISKEDKSNKVTTLSSSSTNTQYPSAKCVYDSISIKNTTYSALKTLRDNSQLVPGGWYKITDYVTTTVSPNTQSAGHQFDVIVRADEVNKLNENAYAAKHSGDTYFANSKLEAWELKYCIDNDRSKFVWADSTNGKGVIYYMKDEFGNECPYDFKNIMFLRYKTTSESSAFYNNLYFGVEFQEEYYPNGATIVTGDTKYLYTFTAYTSGYATISDASLNSESGVTCYENVIKSCYNFNNIFGEDLGHILCSIVF